MSAAPIVSVVLPVYNGARHLRESIESVLGQDFEDFELLIWDDVSGDGSWDIATGYRDRRIRCHRQSRNLGLFANLNHALDHARGEIVRLWSQDDRMKPECLAREQHFWKHHREVGMFYCRYETIDERGRRVASSLADTTPEVVSGHLADEISFNWGSMPGNISTVSLPRRVLEQVGFFDTRMRLAADFEMWVRIHETRPVGFCGERLIELRRHSGQLSQSRGSDLTFLRECREIYGVLHARLPNEMRPQRDRYSCSVHCSQYFHGAVRALLRGEPKHSWELIKEIHQWHHVGLVAVLWLVTGNTRWYRPAPVYSPRGRSELALARGPVHG
jgi:glycosyltransferase involved in cell wall biosynthesis